MKNIRSRVTDHYISAVFIAILFTVFIATLSVNADSICIDTRKQIAEKYNCMGICSDLIKEAVASFDSSFTDNIIGKSYWIEFLGGVYRITGKSIISDPEERYNVYKMKNGQETWAYKGYSIEKYAHNYCTFADDMRGRGIPVVFIQVPFKINKYNNELPYGMEDTTNDLADRFLNLIDNYDNYDLREIIYNNSMTYEDMFYNTDHHWTAKSGLWASNVIAKWISNAYDVDLDLSYLPMVNYRYTDYKDFFLGSQGKRVGIIYSGLDDFVLIEPKYETNYELSIPSLGIMKKGRCEDTILFKEYLKKDLFGGDPGRVYTGDNYSLMTIMNKNSNNDSRILLIKDSFSKSVIPSLASTCCELHVMDLRTYDGIVSEYATENDIDVAIVMYNPSVVVDDNFFEFY